MSDFSIFHWLVVLVLILVLLFGDKIAEATRLLGNGPKNGPPTHPLPVTSPIETSRTPTTDENLPQS